MKNLIVEVYGAKYDLNDIEPLVTAIGHHPDFLDRPGYIGESLYKTKDDKYFLASCYGNWAGGEFFGGDDWRDEIVCDIEGTGNPWAVPMTEIEAKRWAETVYIDANDFLSIFGEESDYLRDLERVEEEYRRAIQEHEEECDYFRALEQEEEEACSCSLRLSTICS